MRPFFSALLLAAVHACGPTVTKSPPPHGKDTQEVTHTVTVSQPTLITTFVATQTQIDSSPDVDEALSDYQLYLSRAVPILEQHGVHVIATNDSIVRWRDSLGTHSMVASDSGGILYLFVLPGGRTKSLHEGVELDGALLAAARDHFGLPIPVPKTDSL